MFASRSRYGVTIAALSLALLWQSAALAGDLDQLGGTWKVTAMSFDGKEVPADVARMMSYSFAKNKATARGRLASAGDRFLPMAGSDDYTVTLGKSGDLKTIDLKPTGRGRTLVGIYDLDGDTLKLCIGYTGQRPKQFSSAGATGVSMMTCQRESK
jgi:uncharacterized protein (TIGR03067 family)